MRFSTIAFVVALRGVVSFGQTSDLTDTRLQANASLVQHNPGSTPIPQMLQQVRAQASAKGIPWKGLHLVSIGDEGVPADVPLTTALPQAYQRQACQADAIVVGRETASASHLSAYATNIYSDYILRD